MTHKKPSPGFFMVHAKTKYADLPHKHGTSMLVEPILNMHYDVDVETCMKHLGS